MPTQNLKELGPTDLCPDVESTLSVVIGAVWQVMKSRETPHYGKVVEFLELIYCQVPELLCYRHRAKLSSGLKGKLVLSMVEKNDSLLNILKVLNCYFPPVFPDDPHALRPDLFRVRQCHFHFRKLILRMIRDKTFRRNYVEKKLHVEYGEEFMAVLEKLLWEFLYRLHTVLTHQTSDVYNDFPTWNKNASVAGEWNYSQITQSDSSPALVIFGMDDTSRRMKSKQHVTSSNGGKTCTAGEQKSQHATLAPCEAQQKTDKSKQQTKELDICRDSMVSEQDTAQFKYFENRSSMTRAPSTISGISDAEHVLEHELAGHLRQTSVFDIFGLDCSAIAEDNLSEKFSPPNPFQSQKIEAKLEKRIMTDLTPDELDDRSQSPVSKACSSEEINKTLRVNHISDITQMAGSNGPSIDEQGLEIGNHSESESGRSVFIKEVASVGNNISFRDCPFRFETKQSKMEVQNSENVHELGFLASTTPPAAHPTSSWRYQPQVNLTRLPISLLNTEDGCKDQLNTTPSTLELVPAAADSEPSQGSWMWLCSFPTDNDSNDPDYYPGCHY